MEQTDTFTEGIRRLYDLMRRVNSPTDLGDVLQEVARAVVEGLGYGVAAISRLDGDELVMTAVAGPDGIPEQILGVRTPVEVIFGEFAQADQWGILRYVPHHRLDAANTGAAWVPDFEPDDAPDAWHPMDTLYAPLYSAEGRLLGNMSVDLPPGGRVPDRQQRELLEMFVVQAGLAIANAEQRERLAEQVRLEQALKSVATARAMGDLEAALAQVTPELQAGLQASQVSLRFFPDAAEGLEELTSGHPTPAQSGERVRSLRQDLVEWVGRSEPRPLVLDAQGGADWELLPRSAAVVRQIMAERGWVRALVTPVGVGRQVLGHLVVTRSADEPPFDGAETAVVAEAAVELGRLVLDARVRETEQRLVAQLQELDRYKGELIATISHELKTPLTSIMGYTELLEDAGVEPASVAAIKRNAERLDRLVTDLLGLSKVQDQRELVRGPVDLVELCRASVELLAVQAATAGVELHLQPEHPSVVVAGDPDELARVVDNIAGNAVKFTPRGGRVVIHVRTLDGHGEVAVADTGIGISVGDQAHLFSAFHRSTNPDALRIPGTGLGLAIARRIAERHGGEITVRSALGQGSTFTLRVPLD